MQVRVAAGGMAAEVVGLPHQPQASFRVPEPVLAEAHRRLRADQIAHQQRAQVWPQLGCNVWSTVMLFGLQESRKQTNHEKTIAIMTWELTATCSE